MPLPVTIIIADDCDSFREGLSRTLTANNFNVVALCGNGLQLIELVKQHQPDIVFIDIRMPGMNGIDACRQLQQLFPHIGKIALTMYHHYHPDVQEMLQAGANGFLSKDASLDEIIRCINTVHSGATHYGSSFQPVVNAMLKGETNAHNLPPHLVELLQLICSGLTSEQIAPMMHRSIYTIGTWRQELLVKCGARNVAELVKFAVKYGVIKL